MKKYLSPKADLLLLQADVLMASGEVSGSANETAKDYIADLEIGNIENI